MDLAEIAKDVFPESVIDEKKGDTDIRNYRVDFSKIVEILGYKIKYTVPDGLNELREVFESNVIPNIDSEIFSNIETIREKQIDES